MFNGSIIFDREVYQMLFESYKSKITTKFSVYKKKICHCGQRLEISAKIKKDSKLYYFSDACATLGWTKEMPKKNCRAKQ